MTGLPMENGRRSPVLSGQILSGVLLLLAVVLLAMLGPWLAPYGPTELIGAPYEAAGPTMRLGADALGRDVLSRFLWGGRNVVWMATLAAVLSTLIGAAAGLAAAWSGRWIDAVLMRGVDLVMAFPTIVFSLLFVTMFGRAPWLLVVLVAVSMAPGVARVTRGAALGVIGQDYVTWARSVGLPARRILLREVLPNIIGPLMVEFGLRLMWSVSLLSALSFLGYGIAPPNADWGLMVNENRNAIAFQPWAVLAPVFAIAAFATGCNLVVEGIARRIGRTEGRAR